MEPRILTIDDDAVIRAMVCAALRGHACQVLHAASGAAGLALAQQERPDLILLDYNLPDMNGAEVLGQLKADPELRQVPVVMFTINAQRESVERVLKLGIQDYLIKPFTKHGLVERLGRLVSLKPRPIEVSHRKRADDPLNILVVDYKPAIAEQIRRSVATTPWKVHALTEGEEAVAFCAQTIPDVILISLSLPGDFGFTLFQIIRSHPPTKDVPILGLVLKTATQEQSRATQVGFNGFVTKPIDLAGLPTKIAQALGLDTSGDLFHRHDDCLVLSLPAQLDSSQTAELESVFYNKLRDEMEAGLQRAVIDFSAVQSTDENLIKLAARMVEFCGKSGIEHALVAPESLRAECQKLGRGRDWTFAASCEAATRGGPDRAIRPAGETTETGKLEAPTRQDAAFTA